MNIKELKQACKSGEGQIALRIPREPTGGRIRLTEWSGPLGEVINVTEGGTLARFDRASLLAWCERQTKIPRMKGQRS